MLFGMSGEERRAILRAWLLWIGLIATICVVNVLTIQHDDPDLAPLFPALWEGSSALITLAIFAIPAAVALWSHRNRPLWWQAAPVHLVAVLAYSALHVAGFVALRKLAYLVVLQQTYDFGDLSSEFPYEFRKDVLAYGAAWIIFFLSLRHGRQQASALASPALATFDIQDGARLMRVPIDDILAVRSAGNYVEFVLVDSRRPLMRTPLASVQTDLTEHGFVRSHRSWLVNKAKVTGLRPEGSGDYAVELGELEAPLSRRFPEALAALRG
ncbi:LytTR family DNA-binding domain-containing protein [Caulobacter sp. ErkDOM-YI]|uniref:LytTR family DNA-binding domain-containing protein n=1 Tax=unclassified Caulobacter TaxID=2648921 RepID=UPI003AF6ACAC